MNSSSPSAGAPLIPQAAVAPLNTIDPRDIGLSAQALDQWLRSISGDAITLERLRTVAGALPAVGNIIALADSLGDIITLAQAKERHLLDWASLGINLIGVIPLPPGMAAARMSLRPTLMLVRQELLKNSKALLGDALITVLATHLNASIVGEIDTFAQQAQTHLNTILAEAGQWGHDAITEMAHGLQALASASLDAGGDAARAGRHMQAAGQQLLHDPRASIGNFLQALWSCYQSAGKAAANAASRAWLGEPQRQQIQRQAQALLQFAPHIQAQIPRLGDAATEHSIGYLLAALVQACARWRARGAPRISANVQAGTTSRGGRVGGQGMLEAHSRQSRAQRDPHPQRNGICAGTCGSISFATGSETLSHTDFQLPGPFPLQWTRTYRSSLGALDQGALGARWISDYTTSVQLQGAGVRYHGADGRSHDWPLPAIGQAHTDPIEGLTLIRTSEQGLAVCQGFERRETYQRHGDRFLLERIELRGGAGVLLRHTPRSGQPCLSELITYQDHPEQSHLHLRTDTDEHGRILGLWLIHPQGGGQRRLSQYHYDHSGDLTQASDEHGQSWHYQYQHHLLNRYSDRSGRHMNLQWQGNGPDARAVREWADDGSFDTRLHWDPQIRLTRITDAHGQPSWHYYDILGYTYRIIHPDQRSEWLLRDSAKNITCHIHPDGSQQHYAWDDNANLLQHTRADASTVHYAWDRQNQPIKISDPEGGLWQRDYDSRGRLTETIDPLGHKTEYAYHLTGQPTAITDASGKQKQLEYNASGQLTRYTDCSGHSSTWAYDERGQLSQHTDASGHTTHYRHECGHLAAIIHPDASEEHLVHDPEGRLLQHTDAQGRHTHWSYSEAGLLAQRTDAAGHSLHYEWDKLGRLTGLRNENARQAQWHYDASGRLREETGFDGTRTRYEYDPASGRLARILESQRTTAVSFDAMGRLTERRAALTSGPHGQPNPNPSWQVETYAYDGNGRLALARNAHSLLQCLYDPGGNLVREHLHYRHLRQPLAAVWQHEYNSLNQRIATTRPDGQRIDWLRYGNGHLLALHLNQRELLSCERDTLHQETERHQGNRLRQSQQWDPMGRLSAQTLATPPQPTPQTAPPAGPPGPASAGQRLLVRNYRYDRTGQLTDINDSRRGQLSYRYDPVGRLLEAQSRLAQEQFDFDPAGNLLDPPALQQARQQNQARPRLLDNLLLQYAGTHYQYDEHGQLSTRWHNGHQSSYRWDAFGRLSHYDDERLSVRYAYDALGRRLSKHSQAHHVDDPRSGTMYNLNVRLQRNRELDCALTLYGWDGDQLAWESRVADEDGQGACTIHYLYEPDSFVPLAQARHGQTIRLRNPDMPAGPYRQELDPLYHPPPAPPAIEQLAWYQCDHLGTPQELTDEQGRIAWSAEYRAWGVVKEVLHKASDGRVDLRTPLRFQGQYHDHETGLHYNRHRYYDPQVGRFISKDPIGYLGGYNTHQYAPSPTNWIDPLGLQRKKSCHCVDRLPDEAIVCRGGSCTSDKFRDGAGVTVDKNGKLNGVSVNSAPNKTLDELTVGIPHGKIGVTTVGDVRAAGGDVIASPTANNRNHATLSGIAAEKSEELMTPTVRNPNAKRS